MGGRSDVIRYRRRKSFLGPLACFTKSSVAMYPEENSAAGGAAAEENSAAGAVEENSAAGAAEENSAAGAASAVVEEREARVEVILRSCMRKKVEDNRDQEREEESVRGRVKWMDSLGKDLVVVKEYEASHYVDSDEPNCVCVIQ